MYNPGTSLRIKSKFEFSDTPTLTGATEIIDFNVRQITAYKSILPPTVDIPNDLVFTTGLITGEFSGTFYGQADEALTCGTADQSDKLFINSTSPTTYR
jgi:hypothetical protein